MPGLQGGRSALPNALGQIAAGRPGSSKFSDRLGSNVRRYFSPRLAPLPSLLRRNSQRHQKPRHHVVGRNGAGQLHDLCGVEMAA